MMKSSFKFSFLVAVLAHTLSMHVACAMLRGGVAANQTEAAALEDLFTQAEVNHSNLTTVSRRLVPLAQPGWIWIGSVRKQSDGHVYVWTLNAFRDLGAKSHESVVATRWDGVVCGDATSIMWNIMRTYKSDWSTLLHRWTRQDYAAVPGWVPHYVGTGCGNSPTLLPLPTRLTGHYDPHVTSVTGIGLSGNAVTVYAQHTLSVLCSNGGPVITRWDGVVCGGEGVNGVMVQWNQMRTTGTHCNPNWNRGINGAAWDATWLGGCGVSPTYITLPVAFPSLSGSSGCGCHDLLGQQFRMKNGNMWIQALKHGLPHNYWFSELNLDTWRIRDDYENLFVCEEGPNRAYQFIRLADSAGHVLGARNYARKEPPYHVVELMPHRNAWERTCVKTYMDNNGHRKWTIEFPGYGNNIRLRAGHHHKEVTTTNDNAAGEQWEFEIWDNV